MMAEESYAAEPLAESFSRWIAHAPSWRAASACQQQVNRFLRRTEAMQKRFGQPLVVTLLGGSGTGKSTLINALVGEEVVTTGRARPTTIEPTLICHTTFNVESLQLAPLPPRIVRSDAPLLERICLIDAPDPDTSDIPENFSKNTSEENSENVSETAEISLLAQLRAILPQCEVIIVVGTQQKYGSNKVLEELLDAASGTRLIFVQTHRDRDANITDDWQRILATHYETGHVFCVDSVAALAAQHAGKTPDGEFVALKNLLADELTSSAARCIREANYLDLAAETVTQCRATIAGSWQAIERLDEKMTSERRLIGKETAEMMCGEMMRDRRQMESRLIGRISLRWGYSPFSLLLRCYQNLGGLLSSTLLFRARSASQLAVWGVWESARSWRNWRDKKRNLQQLHDGILLDCEESRLRSAALILAGFADDAQLDNRVCAWENVQEEARRAGGEFVAEVARSLDQTVDELADRFNSIFFRIFFETAFSAMLIFLIARPAKNFFWDTLVHPATPILGADYYLVSLFWLALWGGILLGIFILTMRYGLEKKITRIAQSWNQSDSLQQIFAGVQQELQKVYRFRDALNALAEQVAVLTQIRDKIDARLGKRKR